MYYPFYMDPLIQIESRLNPDQRVHMRELIQIKNVD